MTELSSSPLTSTLLLLFYNRYLLHQIVLKYTKQKTYEALHQVFLF